MAIKAGIHRLLLQLCQCAACASIFYIGNILRFYFYMDEKFIRNGRVKNVSGKRQENTGTYKICR